MPEREQEIPEATSSEQPTESAEAPPPALTRSTDPPRPKWLGFAVRSALWAAATSLIAAVGIAGFLLFCVDTSLDEPAYEQLVTEPQRAVDDAIGEAIPIDRNVRVEPADHDHWRGVTTSTGPYAVVAVWSDAEIFVSRDDGRTFSQALAGPGEVAGTAFDEAGNLFAIRGRDLLGIQRPDGTVSWRSLPFSGATLAVATGAGWLGWLHLQEHEERGAFALVSLSYDQGTTWRHQVVPSHGNTENSLRIESDGTIRIMGLSEDCHLQETERHEGHVDGRAFREIAWPDDLAAGWGMGSHGWAYTIGTACDGADDGNDLRLCAIGPGPLPAVQATGHLVDWDLRVATNERTTLASSGRLLLQLDANRSSLIDSNAPLALDHFAIDGIGRAVGSVGSTLVRWSPRHGWRVLFAPDGLLFEDRVVEGD